MQEILEQIIPKDDAAKIIQSYKENWKELLKSQAEELKAITGVRLTSARKVNAAIQLYSHIINDTSTPKLLLCAEEVANYVRPYYDMSYESMIIVGVNTRNQPLYIEEVFRGSDNKITINVKKIFRTAVLRNANGIFVTHNHPSGSTLASPEDIATTRALINAGKIIEIKVIDHVIVTQNDFLSIRTEMPDLFYVY